MAIHKHEFAATMDSPAVTASDKSQIKTVSVFLAHPVLKFHCVSYIYRLYHLGKYT